jgi:hypothetical protein
MWWETLIVGLLVAAAALWSGRQAVRSVRAMIRGRGCSSGGCGLTGDKSDRATTQARELVQVGLDRPGHKGERAPQREK